LKFYSSELEKIDLRFDNKRKLSQLADDEVGELINLVLDISKLCFKNETKIDGFGVSYLSALLSAYFPDLIPILDRRVLINLKIPTIEKLSTGQIKDIHKHYGLLIMEMAKESKNRSKSIRDIDREYFIMDIK